MKTNTRAFTADSAGRLLLMVTSPLFVIEMIVHLTIRSSDASLPWDEALVNAVISSVITFPLLYFIVLRPLSSEIEDRKRIEEKLNLSEQKYRLLFEASQAGVYRSTLKGQLLECNDKFARMFGFESASDLKRVSAQELYDSDSERNHFIECLQVDGWLENYESLLRKKDGTPIWILESVVLMEDGGQKILQGVAIDITDRKKVEDTLRESEETFRRLFEESTDPILILDDTGFTDCNEATVTLLGYHSKPEFLKKNPWELSPEKQPDGRLSSEKAQAMIARALQEGHHRFEWIHTKADGSDCEVEVMLTSIVLKGKQSYYTVWRDISDRKKAEKSLVEANERLALAQWAAGAGTWDWDMITEKLVWSPELFMLFGIEPSHTEAGFETWNSLFHPEDRSIAEERIREAIRNRTPLASEYRIITPAGEVRWLNALGNTTYNEHGDAVRMTGIIIDVTERKEAEAEIRLLANAMKSIHECVSITDTENTLLFVNESFVRTYGYTQEELIGQNIRMVRSTKNVPEMTDKILAAALGVEWQGEIWNRRKDGTEFQVHLTATRIEDSNGKIIALIGVATDITERKRAEKTLKDSEEKFRNYIESAPDGVFAVNPAGFFQDVNTAACDLLGHTREELLAMHLSQVVSKEHLQRAASSLETLKRDGRYFAEMDFVRKGDSNFTGMLSAVKISENEFLGFVKDITERKLSEEALRESEKRFRALSDSANEAFVSADSSGDIVGWNPGAERIFGYTEREVIGKPITILMPLHFRSLHVAGIARMQAGEAPHLIGKTTEVEGQRKDGSDFPIELSLSSWEAGGNLYYTGIMRDITLRKKAQNALRKSESSLQAVMRSTADGILAVGRENEVLYANDRFAEIWRIPQAMLESKDDSALIRYVLDQLLDPQSFIQKVRDLYKSDKESFDTLYFKDGRIFERLSRPLLQDAEVHGRVWSFRDVTERKQAEDALKESETRYRTLVEWSPEAIVVHQGGTIQYVNPSAIMMFGATSAQDLIGMPILDRIHPEFHNVAMSRADDIIAAEGILTPMLEEKLLKLDGTVIDAEVQSTTIIYDGDIVLHTSIRDVTTRKKAQEALRISEGKYRDLFDNANDAICILDGDLRFKEINSKVTEITGYSREELLGKKVFDIIAKEVLPFSLEEFKKLRTDGSYEKFLGKIITKSGSIRDIEVNSSAIIEDNKVVGSRDIIRDITERNRAEEELRKSRESFRGYFESGSVGMCVTSIEKGWIEVNDRLCLMFGYSKKEITRSTWADLTHPDDLNSDLELFEQVLSGKRDRYELDKRFIHKSGSIVYTTINVSCQRNSDGTVDHFLASIVDITDRKKAEYTLEERIKELNCLYSITALMELPTLSLDDMLSRIVSLIPPAWQFEDITEARIEVSGRMFQTHRFRETSWMMAHEIMVNGVVVGRVEVCYLEERPSANVGPFLKEEQRVLLVIAEELSLYIKRMWAEEELRESERQLRESQKIASLGSYVFDIPTGTWKSSEIFDAIFRIDEMFVRSKENWFSLIHPEWREMINNYFVNDVLGSHQRFDKEYKIIRLDGQERWVHGFGELDFDSNGDPVRLSGSLMDVTDQKAGREKTKQMETLGILGEFSAMTAHEIRNPLTAVTLNLQSLKRSIDPSKENNEMFDDMFMGINRIKQIIDDILAYSHIGKPVKSQCDLGEITDLALKSVQTHLTEIFSIRKKYDIRASYPLFCDQGQIVQVMGEVLINTMRSMPDGGVIGIDIKPENGNVKIIVQNSGKGMTKLKTAESFFSSEADELDTRSALIQRILLSHDAQIEMQSGGNKIASVTLTFQ